MTRLSKDDFTAADRKAAGQDLAERIESKGQTTWGLAAVIATVYGYPINSRAHKGFNTGLRTLYQFHTEGKVESFASNNTQGPGWSFLVLAYLLGRPVDIEPQLKPIAVAKPKAKQQEVRPSNCLEVLRRQNEATVQMIHELHMEALLKFEKAFKIDVLSNGCYGDQLEGAYKQCGMPDEIIEQIFN